MLKSYPVELSIEETGISSGYYGFSVIYLEKFVLISNDKKLANQQIADKVVKAFTTTRLDLSLEKISVDEGNALSVQFNIDESTHFETMIELFETLEQWTLDIKELLSSEFTDFPFNIKWNVYGQF